MYLYLTFCLAKMFEFLSGMLEFFTGMYELLMNEYILMYWSCIVGEIMKFDFDPRILLISLFVFIAGFFFRDLLIDLRKKSAKKIQREAIAKESKENNVILKKLELALQPLIVKVEESNTKTPDPKSLDKPTGKTSRKTVENTNNARSIFGTISYNFQQLRHYLRTLLQPRKLPVVKTEATTQTDQQKLNLMESKKADNNDQQQKKSILPHAPTSVVKKKVNEPNNFTNTGFLRNIIGILVYPFQCVYDLFRASPIQSSLVAKSGVANSGCQCKDAITCGMRARTTTNNCEQFTNTIPMEAQIQPMTIPLTITVSLDKGNRKRNENKNQKRKKERKSAKVKRQRIRAEMQLERQQQLLNRVKARKMHEEEEEEESYFE